MAENNSLEVLPKQNKKLLFAILIAAFGLLLFIAFSRTLP